jgi:hypothetical protein
MALQLEPQGLLFAEVTVIYLLTQLWTYYVFWLPFIAFITCGTQKVHKT